VIEALRTGADPARFVLAYPSEHALLPAIAASSIIAFGFSSREEAEAGATACVSAAAA